MNDAVSSMRVPFASLSHAECSRSSSVKLRATAGTERPDTIPETMHIQLTRNETMPRQDVPEECLQLMARSLIIKGAIVKCN